MAQNLPNLTLSKVDVLPSLFLNLILKLVKLWVIVACIVTCNMSNLFRHFSCDIQQVSTDPTLCLIYQAS